MRKYAGRDQAGKKILGLASALLGTGLIIRIIPVSVWYGVLAALVLLLILLLFLTR